MSENEHAELEDLRAFKALVLGECELATQRIKKAAEDKARGDVSGCPPMVFDCQLEITRPADQEDINIRHRHVVALSHLREAIASGVSSANQTREI